MWCFILPDGFPAPLNRLDRPDRRPNLPCAMRSLDRENTYHETRQNCLRNRSASAPATARLGAHVPRARFGTSTATAPPPRPHEDVSRRWTVGGALSVPRDTRITVYVDDEMKDRLDERVEDSSETISSYANKAIDQRLQAEANDELAREVRAEERIRELVSIATDEVQQATEEMRDLNAKTGAYAAANFELLKTDHKDGIRRDALSTGSRRMRTDLDVVQDRLDDAADTDTEQSESGADAPAPATDDDDSGRKGPFERMKEDDDVRE